METGSNRKNPQKELFRAYSRLSPRELMEQAVRYAEAPDAERQGQVALIRALGVVVGQQGTPEDLVTARRWMLDRLQDSLETVRRYAITALPRLEAGPTEEAALLARLELATPREREALLEALQKLGGKATLERFSREVTVAPVAPVIVQKVTASMAREANSRILLDRPVAPEGGLVVALRGRQGLESVLERELHGMGKLSRPLPKRKVMPGAVTLRGRGPIPLKTLYAARCFDTLNFVLGRVQIAPEASLPERLALTIAKGSALGLLEALTDGPLRYRLDFSQRVRQGRATADVVRRVFELEPRLLNDSRQAPWTIHVRPDRSHLLVELSPHKSVDPRFRYRQGDIPAASHPPLAAALAFLAAIPAGAMVWDPFCGTASELIECRLRSDVRVIGTDLSAEALATAAANWAAAGFAPSAAEWVKRDFRDWGRSGLAAGSLDAIVTNPPMGRRVPVGDLNILLKSLFAMAERVLKPGGVLVLANPIEKLRFDAATLRRTFRAKLDMGGFPAWLERYERV